MSNNSRESGNTIKVAIIGALASIAVAFITANYKAKKEAKSEAATQFESQTAKIDERLSKLNLSAGGFVAIDGTLSRSSGGLSFTPRKGNDGEYYIDFAKPFEVKPIVVATAQGGKKGVRVIVQEVTNQTIKIEGREYSGNGLTNTAFHFIAVVPN